MLFCYKVFKSGLGSNIVCLQWRNRESMNSSGTTRFYLWRKDGRQESQPLREAQKSYLWTCLLPGLRAHTVPISICLQCPWMEAVPGHLLTLPESVNGPSSACCVASHWWGHCLQWSHLCLLALAMSWQVAGTTLVAGIDLKINGNNIHLFWQVTGQVFSGKPSKFSIITTKLISKPLSMALGQILAVWWMP